MGGIIPISRKVRIEVSSPEPTPGVLTANTVFQALRSTCWLPPGDGVTSGLATIRPLWRFGTAFPEVEAPGTAETGFDHGSGIA
jgi:hypothetical protein